MASKEAKEAAEGPDEACTGEGDCPAEKLPNAPKGSEDAAPGLSTVAGVAADRLAAEASEKALCTGGAPPKGMDSLTEEKSKEEELLPLPLPMLPFPAFIAERDTPLAVGTPAKASAPPLGPKPGPKENAPLPCKPTAGAPALLTGWLLPGLLFPVPPDPALLQRLAKASVFPSPAPDEVSEDDNVADIHEGAELCPAPPPKPPAKLALAPPMPPPGLSLNPACTSTVGASTTVSVRCAFSVSPLASQGAAIGRKLPEVEAAAEGLCERR